MHVKGVALELVWTPPSYLFKLHYSININFKGILCIRELLNKKYLNRCLMIKTSQLTFNITSSR